MVKGQDVRIEGLSESIGLVEANVGENLSEKIQMANPDDSLLSVIVPIRVKQNRLEILERLDLNLSDPEKPANVEFLVVDDGSESHFAADLKCRCEGLGIKYLSTEIDPSRRFNLARARNFGARHARGKLLLFMDVDLRPYSGFYDDILIEAEFMEMTVKIDRFLMCPVIYLTTAGYEKYQKLPEKMRKPFCINEMLSANQSHVEKYSHGTSVILVNRHYYMCRGGQNEAYEGWGYEDYEFTTRLMLKNPQFPIPKNWASMAGNFMTIDKYEGWKAAYRLHGDWLGNKGIYLVHVPHEVDEIFRQDMKRNEKLLVRHLKQGYDREEPEPLPHPEFGPSLLLRKNPFCYSREFAPYLGQVHFAKEDEFPNIAVLEKYLCENGIRQIVFGNPYANEELRAIYDWCRNTSFPFVVCERGALPDSIYHDRSGFLSDGDSYEPEKWDRPLSNDEIKKTEDYISEVRNGSEMLEKQAERRDFESIREKLNIRDGKKIVLVPFQQPNDTTVRKFAKSVKGFEKFREVIASLPAKLGDEWCVVYKKHPVEDEIVKIPGAINADDVNIYDLIEMSDVLVVINSGTGLFGLMFEKPVFIMGEAFYAHEDLNVTVSDPCNLAEKLNSEFIVDRKKMQRFVHYLRYEFYSFGIQFQRKVRYDDGSPITATSNIYYYETRGWRERECHFHSIKNQEICRSPLYDRYRGQSNSCLMPMHKKGHDIIFGKNDSKIDVENFSMGDVVESKRSGSAAHLKYEGIFNLACKNFHSKRFAEALGNCEEALILKPNNANLRRVIAEVLIVLGRRREAAIHLRRACSLVPENKAVRRRRNEVVIPGFGLISGNKPFPVPLK